ncbi:MAG TPA: tRNA (adenosine(37)-N6)-threonylcarbamoyltransferase complex ATPase subunit type 1 TsaE [Candidatus Omnitrophica bacterium]|nr:MAG: tRNA (adenosine(37)-N6)-threonylcarbamoyltransferase complex ATPase subunit type 1 TsaE [Omnitrophica WOR_2 bacterium GWA2_45_18]HBR14910.1 tRNA (adenosine(37)-N6)-threonylcarbamoyltransferase complex ATPase subunit type 1 TsaE [Candidatus Omnitrophota bacterium]
MKSIRFISKDQEETIRFGEQLGGRLRATDIVCLFGELGSGKTTFVKGVAMGMKISAKKVSSPTFILMNLYEGRVPLYHFDLYRLGDGAGILSLGYEEFLYGQGIAVVEWADRLGTLLPKEYLAIHLNHRKEGKGRTIEMKAWGQRYEEVLEKWDR